jgi:hypothetical protein
MINRVSVVVAMACAFCFPLMTPSPAMAQSYPMTCEISSASLVLVDIGRNLATVTFSRSNGPVASGLQPGQCAWSDRAVRTDEPAVLCLEASIDRITLRSGSTSSGSFNGPGAAVLQSAIYGPTKLMNFMVQQSNIPSIGGLCMQIESYGP